MGKPHETFNKKEQEKKRAKKKKAKEQKKEERRANADKGKTPDEMIAYVDAYGNIVSTPPDPSKKPQVKAEDVRISVMRREDEDPADLIRTGTVIFFNDSKGFGFIKDLETQENVFVHINGLDVTLKENDKVTFETEREQKGLRAVKVKHAV